MARLKGTGTDPLGQIVKGQVCDAPYGSAEYIDAVKRGYAVPVPPEDNPGTTPIEVANAVVRGDDFASNPAAARVADGFQLAGQDPESGQDPYSVVHRQDPAADDNHNSTPGPNASPEELELIRAANAPREEVTLGGTDPNAQQTDLGTTGTSSKDSESASAPAPQPNEAPEPQGTSGASQEEQRAVQEGNGGDDIDRLSGDALDKAVADAGIDASKGGSRADGGLNADEKRAALRAKRSA
jgi:hypothetical protein